MRGEQRGAKKEHTHTFLIKIINKNGLSKLITINKDIFHFQIKYIYIYINFPAIEIKMNNFSKYEKNVMSSFLLLCNVPAIE